MTLIDRVQWKDMNCSEPLLHLVWVGIIWNNIYSIDAVGYNLSPQAIGCVLRRYSTDGKISFDDFVSCVTKLRSLTSEYCNNACHKMRILFYGDTNTMYDH